MSEVSPLAQELNMAYEIPGIGSANQGIPKFWDAELNGQTKLGGTAIAASAADLNLLNGLATAGISPAKVLEKEVNCSAGGTAQTAAIGTIPAGSIIVEVLVWCTEAFNGGATKTFEVGVAGNTDKYVDPDDCPVTLNGVICLVTGTNNDQKVAEPTGAAIAIIATWTNTASATAGKMKVKVIYG